MTKNALKSLKNEVKDRDILKFKNDIRTINKTFFQKVIEKSTLKYSFVRGVSCFNPPYLVTINQNLARKRLSIVLEKLVECNIISPISAEKIEKEFKELI